MDALLLHLLAQKAAMTQIIARWITAPMKLV
jgi:hypothetical protein